MTPPVRPVHVVQGELRGVYYPASQEVQCLRGCLYKVLTRGSVDPRVHDRLESPVWVARVDHMPVVFRPIDHGGLRIATSVRLPES